MDWRNKTQQAAAAQQAARMGFAAQFGIFCLSLIAPAPIAGVSLSRLLALPGDAGAAGAQIDAAATQARAAAIESSPPPDTIPARLPAAGTMLTPRLLPVPRALRRG